MQTELDMVVCLVHPDDLPRVYVPHHKDRFLKLPGGGPPLHHTCHMGHPCTTHVTLDTPAPHVIQWKRTHQARGTWAAPGDPMVSHLTLYALYPPTLPCTHTLPPTSPGETLLLRADAAVRLVLLRLRVLSLQGVTLSLSLHGHHELWHYYVNIHALLCQHRHYYVNIHALLCQHG